MLGEKKKKPTPAPPESTKNLPPPLRLIAIHPTNPPRATQTHRKSNPHWNQPKTHLVTHQDPLHKTKNQAQNQPNPINFNPLATPKPITDNTITHNRRQSNQFFRYGKSKKKNQKPFQLQSKGRAVATILADESPIVNEIYDCYAILQLDCLTQSLDLIVTHYRQIDFLLKPEMGKCYARVTKEVVV
jgi:hypothetical protein